MTYPRTGKHWTNDELGYLRAHYPTTPSADMVSALGRPAKAIGLMARKLGLNKTPEYLAAHAGRFPHGLQPWNKGVRGRTGHQDGCRATQFKPGRPAKDSANYRPIGSIRLSVYGYIEQKVTDDRSLYPARRWSPVHRLVWERDAGPIPPGHIVVFKRGQLTTDPKLITIDRLECITRAENMRRNTCHRYGKDVATLVQLRAAITRQIRKKEKELTK